MHQIKASEKDEIFRVVKIALEHLRSDTWIAYPLDSSDWIDQIRCILERDDNARLVIEVEEMGRETFEDLPEHRDPRHVDLATDIQ